MADGIVNENAGDAMSIAERNILFNEVVSQIRSIGITALCTSKCVLGNDLHLRNHGGHDLERSVECINRVERQFFVFLHILVVGKRKALHHGQERI